MLNFVCMMDLVAQDIVSSLFCKFPFPAYSNLIVLVHNYNYTFMCSNTAAVIYAHANFHV